MKNKIKTIITSAFILALSNMFTSFAFAESTIKNSIGSIDMEDNGTTIGVDETQIQKTEYSNEIITDSEENTKVYVSQASSFGVYIPKVLTLDGKKNDANENKANYIVRLSEYSNFAGKEKVLVVPEEEFTLSQLGKEDIQATVEQDKQEWLHNEVDVVGNGEVTATNMSAGSWKGVFYFNIELKDTNVEVDYSTIAFNDLTWEQIATLSDNNKFLDYYEIGATKTFEYEGNTYTAEVIGVNTYNNGELTFMTKELLPTKYALKNTATTLGGWPDCEIRTTLNDSIFNNLPNDLKLVVTPKTLMYETSKGTIATAQMVEATDKLWLPTMYELAGNWIENEENDNYIKNYRTIVSPYQKVYDAFENVITSKSDLLIKKSKQTGDDMWWIAAPHLSHDKGFINVNSEGLLYSSWDYPTTERYIPLCFVI